MAKKKSAKTPQSLFQDWWKNTASKKVTRIEKKWIKENKPNDPDEDGGGDYWYVNQMMHDREAYNMTYDSAEEAFLQGYSGLDLDTDRLYCELDTIITESYEAGKNAK